MCHSSNFPALSSLERAKIDSNSIPEQHISILLVLTNKCVFDRFTLLVQYPELQKERLISSLIKDIVQSVTMIGGQSI